MTLGGAALKVQAVTTGLVQAGPPTPITIVSDGRSVQGGPAQPIVVVTTGLMQAGPAVPVVAASYGDGILAGPAIPVYVVGSGYLPLLYASKVLSTGPIAYWPLDEASGTTITDRSGNGRNGVYTAVTLGQAGVGDGGTAASFDGSTSFGNVFSASLAAAFSGAEGSIALWARVSAAGVWTDATVRRLVNFQADANNRIFIQRPASNNTLDCTMIAGATTKTVSFATGAPTGWFHVAMTWSKSADQLKAYLNGAQVGATQTGLGVFAGAIAATTTCLGSTNTAPANVWSGLESSPGVWNRALSTTEIASLATL